MSTATASAPINPVASILVPRVNIGIFCDSPQTAQVMELAATDRRMARAHVTVQMGGIPAATQMYSQEPTPNVVMVESRGDRTQIMTELGQLAEVCGPATKVVVLGHVNDIILFRELMKNHVSDYLVGPFTSLQIIDSIATLYNDPKAPPLGRVLAFVGAKGGVGSSTIAHNVAYATSAKYDLETILTDLDLSFGTAALNFNQDGGGTFYEALSAPDRVDSTLLERLMSRWAKS